MKPIKRKIHFVSCIICLILLLVRCGDGCVNENAESIYSKPCGKVIADTIPNQLIIEFYNQYANEDYFHEFFEKVKKSIGADTIYRCSCGYNLALVVFDNTKIDPNPAKSQANNDLEEDGKKTGKATFNRVISMDPEPGYFAGSFDINTTSDGPKKNIVIAIIDGGISREDPDLSKHFWVNQKLMDNDPSNDCDYSDTNGYDFTLKNPGYTPEINPHGTIIGRIITDGVGSDECEPKLMDLRVFDTAGNGTLYDALCAINFAIENEAEIINMSWGYYGTKNNDIFHDFMDTLRFEKIIAVASAGNDSIDTDKCLHYPSGFDSLGYELFNVISVAALNKCQDGLKNYSNFGQNTIGLAAKVVKPSFAGYDGPMEGTSFAAPFVTKKIVQIKSDYPDATIEDIIRAIYGNIETVEGLKVISGGWLPDRTIELDH